MTHRIIRIVETGTSAAGVSDPIAWVAAAARAARLDLLLRSEGVTHLRRREALAALIVGGVDVFYVEEDGAARGITPGSPLDRARPVVRDDLPVLLSRYEQVWHF